MHTLKKEPIWLYHLNLEKLYQNRAQSAINWTLSSSFVFTLKNTMHSTTTGRDFGKEANVQTKADKSLLCCAIRSEMQINSLVNAKKRCALH